MLVLLGAYAGGYFWLVEYALARGGVFHGRVIGTFHERRFSHATFLAIYYPMGWIACRSRGEQVILSAITYSRSGKDSRDSKS